MTEWKVQFQNQNMLWCDLGTLTWATKMGAEEVIECVRRSWYKGGEEGLPMRVVPTEEEEEVTREYHRAR